MQVCTSLQTDNHANTSLLSFLQAGCPSCRPTNSVKALKAIKETRKQDQNNAHKAVNGMAEITLATSKSVPGGKTLIKYTHTHPFNSPLSRTTQVSRYQKGKTNLDFTEATDSEWQWHQLGHMQV